MHRANNVADGTGGLPAAEDTISVTPTPTDQHIPLLLVAGDARSLDGSRRVLPIEGHLDIGRGAANGGAQQWHVDDALVSRQHARIVETPQGFEIQDLGSRNGTGVNGVRLMEPSVLNDGALLFVGGHIAVFRMVTADERQAIADDLAHPLGPVATMCPKMAKRIHELRARAHQGVDFLIAGETGVGKEIYAEAAHRADLQRSGPFSAVSCTDVSPDVLEQKLFGGSRTTSSASGMGAPGHVARADGGSLFLDELGDLSAEAQARLLRFVQTRQYRPIGAQRSQLADLRLIAATSRDCNTGRQAGVREDLWQRLGPDPVRLPALRKRKEDIPALLAWLLRKTNFHGFEPRAFQALALFDWPGNVRQLEKATQLAATLREAEAPGKGPDGLLIQTWHLTEMIAQPRRAAPARHTRASRPTKTELRNLLRAHRGLVADVARALDRNPGVVWRWMRNLGLGADDFRV